MNKFLKILVFALALFATNSDVVCADITLTRDSYGSTQPGAFGWKPLRNPSETVVFSCLVRCYEALGFALKFANDPATGKEQWLEVGIGGWNNTGAAIRTYRGDSTAFVRVEDWASNYVFNGSTAAGTVIPNSVSSNITTGATIVNVGTGIIPDRNNSVLYRLMATPEEVNGVQTGKTIITLTGTNSNNISSLIVSCKAESFKQVFTHYSIRPTHVNKAAPEEQNHAYVLDKSIRSEWYNGSSGNLGWSRRGFFGWTPIPVQSRNFSLAFSARAQSDLHIGLQLAPAPGERWIELVIAGWTNSQCAVRLWEGNSSGSSQTLIKNYEVKQDSVPTTVFADGFSVVQQGTCKIPDTANSVSYVLTITPEGEGPNGIATLIATTASGVATTVLSCKAPFLYQPCFAYSFRSYGTYELRMEASSVVPAARPLEPAPFNAGDVLALSLDDGSCFATDASGVLVANRKDAGQCLLDPAQQFKVLTYNKSTGALTLGRGSQVFVLETPAGGAARVKLAASGTPAPFQITYSSANQKMKLSTTGGMLQRNSANTAGPLVINTGSPDAHTTLGHRILTPTHSLLQDLSPVAGLTIDAFRADFVKFSSVFALPSKTAADFNYLTSVLMPRIAAARILDGWAALRDTTIGLLGQITVQAGASGELQNQAVELIRSMTALPQAPMSANDVVVFTLADGSLVSVDPATQNLVPVPAVSASIFNPATHFVITGYQKPIGALTLGTVANGVVVRDASTATPRLKVAASGTPAALQVLYNLTTQKMTFTTEGGTVQRDSANMATGGFVVEPGNSRAINASPNVALTPAQRAFEGISSPTGLTLAAFTTDLAKFELAFGVASKTAADFDFMASRLIPAVNAVIGLSGFTAPPVAPATGTSPRDRAVALLQQITATASTASAAVKTQAQDLITVLQDMPIFLADPTTPPPALSLNANDVFALNLSGATFLVKNATGVAAAASMSSLNPATRFVVSDYNKTTGRICIGVNSSYLRLSNDATATNFVVTGTRRFIDVARDATNPNRFKFSYNGTPATLSAAGLGGNAPSFDVVIPSATKIAFGDLSLVASGTVLTQAAVLSGLQTIDACYKELQDAAKAQATSVSAADWLFFANTIKSYLQIACLVPEWSASAALPTTATQITAPASLADYASAIYLRIIAAGSLISAEAKTIVTSTPSLYSIVNSGDIVSLKFPDGSCLVTDATTNLLKPLQTSMLNQIARFTLASYNKLTGDFTLNAGSNPVCADASVTPNRLKAQAGGTAQVFKSTYDVASKTFSFGFGGNVVQKNSQVDGGPVLVSSSANLENANYIMNFNMVQVGPRAQATAGNAATGVTAAGADATGVLGDLQTYRSQFLAATNTAADWKYLVDTLSGYVTNASERSGWTTPGAVQGSSQSLRDIAVTLFQAAVSGATADEDTKKAATDMIAWLNDQPTFLADPATPPPSLSLNANDSIALKISDGVYLGLSATGTVGASATNILDPSIHFVVSDYNKAAGRICLASGGSYLRLSQDRSSFVLTGTKRFVDIVRDATNPALFSFSYAGTGASFSPQSLGLTSTVASSVTQFTVVGPLPAAQTVFDGLGLYASTTLTPALVQDDITKRIDPVFATMGTIPGDWGFILNTLVAYAVRVAKDIPTSTTMNVTSSNGTTTTTMTFKDYVIGNLTTRFGSYSAAPVEVQRAAASAVATLQGGQAGGSTGDLVLADNSTVLMRMPNADYTSSTLLSVSADGSLQPLPVIAQYLPSVHITVAKYDATAQTVALSYAGKFFDKATGKFSAISLDAASLLTLEQVLVRGSKYYYLNDGGAAKRLTLSDASPAVVSFGATGTQFNIALAQAADSILISLPAPAAVADVEQAFAAYYATLEVVKAESATLAGVASMFNEYSVKASGVVGWGAANAQLSNTTPRDYARSILGLILTDPSYRGATVALKGRVTDWLKAAQFNAPAASGSDSPAPVAQAGQPAYATLNGKTGQLLSDISVFDTALQAAGGSTEDLTTILGAVTSYINNAVTRTDWSPLEAAVGSTTPMSKCVDMLSDLEQGKGVIYPGVTAALATQITGLVAAASNLSAAYATHIAALDALALGLTDAASLGATNPLVTRLTVLVPKIASQGSAEQRNALLNKLDTYVDRKTTVPALRAATDAQKNAWALTMFGFELGVTSFDAKTTALLTEKLGYLNGVCSDRLGVIPQAVQLDALNALLDPCLKKLASECATLVQPTASYSNATSTKDPANVVSIQTFLNSLGIVLQPLQDPTTITNLGLDASSLTRIAGEIRRVWVDAGLKPTAYAASGSSAGAQSLSEPIIAETAAQPVQPRQQESVMATGGV